MGIIVGLIVILLVSGMLATPQQHEEARQRWDRIGKRIFPVTVLIMLIWYIRG